MKIGIVTLPLHFNFGGILQAYALQETLKKLGHNPYIIKKTPQNIKDYIKRLLYNQSRVSQFVRKNIIFDNLSEPFTMSELTSKGYDALIVGSDQVWRPCMGIDRKANVNRYFLKTTNNGKIRKIAYAASFGVDFLDFTEDEIILAQDLVKDFTAVSVREQSGLTLCAKYLNRKDVCQVLDPTMLLGKNDYSHFILYSPFKSENKHCFVYLLDYEKTTNQEIVKTILPENSEVLRAKVERNTLKKYLSSDLTIQNWLSAIYHSDLVITDSFHGCVFSILFHKNFYVIRNDVGGNARINSLLTLLGLEDRLIEKEFIVSKINPINWEFIEEKLQLMRKFSIQYLNKALLK